jgi:hypothetical protein
MIDGLWEKANQVGEIGYKVDSLASVAELLAERLTDNVESSAAWVLVETLRNYGDALDKLSSELMQLNRVEIEEPKKGKKK